MPNIALVGFMEMAKTAVEQRLSERLGMPLIDTDDVTEQDSGVNITAIFAQHGESYS